MNGYNFSSLFHKLIFKYRITVPKTRGHIKLIFRICFIIGQNLRSKQKTISFQNCSLVFYKQTNGKKKVKPLNEN